MFSVPQLVAWITQGYTLESGDVILTGTPVGSRRGAHVPPRWLEDGDVVEITIEGLGTLRNPVVRNQACAARRRVARDRSLERTIRRPDVPSCNDPR